MFQLKKGKEAFTVVEGPLAGRTFKPGENYAEIPPGMAGNFENMNKAAAAKPEAAKPAKAESKKAFGSASSEKGGGKS